MSKLTRRVFFRRTTASMATLGVLAAAPILAPDLAAISEDPEVVTNDLSGVALSDTLIAHVRDLATGEVALMVGTQEIIYRDPDLVMRLIRAVQ